MLSLISITFLFVSFYCFVSMSSHSAITFPDEDTDFGGCILVSGVYKGLIFTFALFTMLSPAIYRLKYIFWLSLPLGIEYTFMLIPDIAYFIKEKRITSFFNILVFVWYAFFLVYYISTY